MNRLVPNVNALDRELRNFDDCFSWTWLNSSVCEADISLQLFKTSFRCDQQGDSHGGVAVYVKGLLYFCRRTDLETGNLESVWFDNLIKH